MSEASIAASVRAGAAVAGAKRLSSAPRMHEVRPGKPGRLPLLVLGSDTAWASIAPILRERLCGDVPVVRPMLAEAANDGVRTLHGAAARVLDLVRSEYPVQGALGVLALEPAARMAHALAIQCLMEDIPLSFVGVIDATCVDAASAFAPEDRWLEELAEVAHNEEHLGHHFDLHWFGQPGRHLSSPATRTQGFARQRLRSWPVAAGDADTLAEQLARAVEGALDVPVTAGKHAPLMTIQSGVPGAEAYFCLPGAGASVIDFIPFSTVIGSRHPVYGLQPRGMCGTQLPAGSVESAANRFVASIQECQPRGVVHVVGHSFGGWLAFETAVRLQAAGRTVGSLTLLDSEAPGSSKRAGHEYTRPEALMLLVGLYEQAAHRPLDLSIDAFEGLCCDEQLSLLHRRLVGVGLLPRASSPGQLLGSVRCFEAAVRTRYRPSGRFDGETRLVLVRGTGETVEAAAMRQYETAEAWRRLAPRLKLRRESGNHITLLRMPHIGETVRWLKTTTTAPSRDEASCLIRA
ncbi:thioesterase domain-containing protein [Thauera sinica]|uniref:Alpha/beta fold hydrolase n=1 Tax=Thauera sinica TaxID=2665146 RepID=A0ABW1AM45_9RHOO|nr:alpha/beta fold hydrolase [Thauera sp. K11]ATE59259.1 hypothetical protein CCZ27_04210 [Thauera sp. K11]